MTNPTIITTKSGLTATLYLADCLDVLPTLGRVDAVITDPPYGMRLAAMSGAGRSKCAVALDAYDVVGDDSDFDPTPYLQFPKVVLFGANHYAERLPCARKWLIWDKREGGTPDDQADCGTCEKRQQGQSCQAELCIFTGLDPFGVRIHSCKIPEV